MTTFRLSALTGLLCLSAAVAAQDRAQEPPKMGATTQAMMEAWQKASMPGAPHRQLAGQLTGTWTAKQTRWMDPSQPPMVQTGRSVNTAELGGRRIRMQFTGEFMGQPFEGTDYSSYDDVTG